MLVWRIKGKIIRTSLCCVVYSDKHTCKQFLHFCILWLDLFLCVYLGFIFCVFFHVSLDHFFLVLHAFVVLYWVQFFSVIKRLAGKNVCEMTYFVSSGM